MENKPLKDSVIVEFKINSGVQDGNGVYLNGKIKRQVLSKSYAEKLQKEDAEKAELYNSDPLVKILGQAYEYFDTFNGKPRRNLLTLEELKEKQGFIKSEKTKSEPIEVKEKPKAGRKPKAEKEEVSENLEKSDENLD